MLAGCVLTTCLLQIAKPDYFLHALLLAVGNIVAWAMYGRALATALLEDAVRGLEAGNDNDEA